MLEFSIFKLKIKAVFHTPCPVPPNIKKYRLLQKPSRQANYFCFKHLYNFLNFLNIVVGIRKWLKQYCGTTTPRPRTNVTDHTNICNAACRRNQTSTPLEFHSSTRPPTGTSYSHFRFPIPVLGVWLFIL